ncbi:MAG: helix-turn-helix domain-containing protein [Proteobacteria bacterium]|nr:helix-turn-helix domain-containing protein [Pseudomonadota bacterium]
MELLGVGERIRIIRGYETIVKFAEKICIHKSTLIRYEKEEGFPDAKTLIKICKTFHINPTWLLFGEGQKETPIPPLTHTASHNALRQRLKTVHASSYINPCCTEITREKYQAYMQGEYVPTEKELNFLCRVGHWDFKTGRISSQLKKGTPIASLYSSEKKITEMDCIFFLMTEVMTETDMGINASTMENMSTHVTSLWNELKLNMKEILISSLQEREEE